MPVYPQVRTYADPFEGLVAQLAELRGLIKIVPPLIDSDRQRRWEEVSQRPSDGEDGDVVDVYGAEAGAEEGYGFADFGRTIRVAAIVFAWAVYHDYLVRELKRSYLPYDLAGQPALAVLVNEDARGWDRRFDNVKKRYKDFGGVQLGELSSWQKVTHARELRNALVHNQGQYTAAYLRTSLAYRPTEEDLHGFGPTADDSELINRKIIPLSATLTDDVITHLRDAATEVLNAVGRAPDGVGAP